ncbi:MAG: ABC transporter permease [Chloroflexota bacterium]|nr:ABC transporter permease [Chloroflexota bacterium]
MRSSDSPSSRSLSHAAWARLRRNRAALFGLIVALTMLLTGLFAPVLAPHSYSDQNLDAVEAPPSLQHPFGTDELGRDMLSRVIWGARTASLVAVVVMAITVSLGLLLGAAAAYLGGWVDTVVMRTCDLLFAFPGMLFALFVAATVKPTVLEVVKGWEATLGWRGLTSMGLVDYLVVLMALSLIGWPGMARLVRGQVLSLREKEFVEAARAMGASDWRIIRKHLLANALGPIIVAISLGMGGTILSESTLSFLGIGIQPPFPSWGAMIYENYSFWRTTPHLVLVPGGVLALVVFAFNFLGDGLVDALNPRRQ